LDVIWKYGAILIVMAGLSLVCGGLAGYTSSTAACGLAKEFKKRYVL